MGFLQNGQPRDQRALLQDHLIYSSLDAKDYRELSRNTQEPELHRTQKNEEYEEWVDKKRKQIKSYLDNTQTQGKALQLQEEFNHEKDIRKIEVSKYLLGVIGFLINRMNYFEEEIGMV